MSKLRVFKAVSICALVFVAFSSLAHALTYQQIAAGQTGKVLGAGIPSIVQSCTSGHYGIGTTASCALPSSLSSDTTLVAVGYSGASSAVLSLSGCGAAWTNVFSDTSSPNFTWDVWTAPSAAGISCSPSQTVSVSNYNLLNVMEISGIGALDATPVDTHPPYCATCSSGSLATVTNGDLVLFTGFIPGVQLTYSNFTNNFIIDQQNTFTAEAGTSGTNATAHLVQSTAGNISTTYTLNGPTSYPDSVLMAFKTTSGSSGGGDTQAPTVPTGLSATAVSSSAINLSWTASTDNIGVTGYKIFRNSSQIGTSATNSYSDTGLNSSTQYTYTVSAYDAAGNNSAQTGGVSATTQAVQSGGSTITAATCSQADVQTAINSATNGSIVQIPAGTCTWTSPINISGIGITIIGQGTPNAGPSTVGAGTSGTILIDNTSTSLFRVTGLTYGQTMRISMLKIQPVAGAGNSSILGGLSFVGICTTSGCPNIRVDNITFPGSWDTPGVEVASGGLILADNVFGVIDHNTASATGNVGPAFVQGADSAWQGIGNWGDNSFATADTFGTSQALYIENNLLSGVRGLENDVSAPGGSLGGLRAVCRDNTFNPQAGSGLCSSHGTSWLGRYRGPRQVEVYGNTVSAASSLDGGTGINGGTEMVFENSWTGSWNKLVSMDVQRDWHAIAPWNYCDGAQPYDQNDGIIYASGVVTTGGQTTLTDSSKSWTTNQWAGSAIANGTPYSIHDVTQNVGSSILSNTANQYSLTSGTNGYITWNPGDTYQILRATICIDQPGRGGGALLQGTTPVLASTGNPGPVNQVLDPVYEWADTHSGGGGTPIQTSSPRLLANRDFYNETANQAAQTSPSSPFNGTSGTGHGTLANRPNTCTPGVGYWATDQGSWNQSGSGGQGELFVCQANNNWTMYYSPFTYPYPLTASGLPNPSAGSGGGSVDGISTGGDTTPPTPPTGVSVQ